MTDSDSAFARLRFTGGRFEADGMPVEALAEVVAYRELIISLAKDIFRNSHPGRQRLPSAFADRIELRLRKIEDGSAIPVLERLHSEVLPIPDEFTEARNVIEDAIAAVAAGGPVPAIFLNKAPVLFGDFGRSLRHGEAIELLRERSDTGPRYTRDVWRRLVQRERSNSQDEVRDVGWVWEMDSNRMSCLIRLHSGPPSPIPAIVDEIVFGPLRNAMEPNGQGPPVHISGLGVFDADRGLVRLVSIYDVTLIANPADLVALDERFRMLEGLQQGWLDGEGSAPTPASLRNARAVMTEFLRLDAPLPRLYPTPDGGVQAEWTSGDYELSVTFEPEGEFHGLAVNITTGESDELGEADAEVIARFVERVS